MDVQGPDQQQQSGLHEHDYCAKLNAAPSTTERRLHCISSGVDGGGLCAVLCLFDDGLIAGRSERPRCAGMNGYLS